MISEKAVSGRRPAVRKKMAFTGRWPLAATLLISTLLTAGCSSILDKLNHINEPPPQTAIIDPQQKPDYKPLNWPLPQNPPPQKQYANSLWQPGARAFFRDGRASRVGDILKVNININDNLQFNNQTEGKRTTIDQANAPSLLGLGSKIVHFLPETQANPASLLNTNGTLDTKGTGTIQRQDIVVTHIAVMVTQMLPDGNMVIDGSQEVTMNQDVRVVSVKGVIRPQDIKSDNTIDSTQIAEARIVYSGRGQLNDMQKPRWGGQIIDAVSPF
ncbi:MAG: flagellar basal body L-ring protein FlgH [Pseudomonadota bacterium]|nr:flagellar basal body L-ring protein FlgH [Pseudomonadota bacterium]MDE3038177.1 flagellar basal body L-ring protein FlgH [Pseudomonadota bacterium]